MRKPGSWPTLLVTVLSAGLLACQPGGGEADTGRANEEPSAVGRELPEPPPRVTELSNTQRSIFSLAEALLDRIEANDLEGLMALRVNEAEFYWIVWPELPSSQPGRGLTWDYVWRDLNQKSINSARRVLDRYEGRTYQLMRVEFEDETTDYGSFLVHRDARVVVEDANGELRTLDLFGSVIEMNGRYKAFSLVTD
jgi:hypothetical protein